jgi:hypothetical protein
MDVSGIPADDELIILMKETIRKTREDGYILNMNGIFNTSYIAYQDRHYKKIGRPEQCYKEGESPFNFTNPRLRLLFSIIPLILRKSDRKHVYSYNGKHVVEKLFKHGYISNGEFILVCISLGYKWKYETNTPNCNIFGLWSDTIAPVDHIREWHEWHFPC